MRWPSLRRVRSIGMPQARHTLFCSHSIALQYRHPCRRRLPPASADRYQQRLHIRGMTVDRGGRTGGLSRLRCQRRAFSSCQAPLAELSSSTNVQDRLESGLERFTYFIRFVSIVSPLLGALIIDSAAHANARRQCYSNADDSAAPDSNQETNSLGGGHGTGR
jgi:hypothetical protein